MFAGTEQRSRTFDVKTSFRIAGQARNSWSALALLVTALVFCGMAMGKRMVAEKFKVSLKGCRKLITFV